MEVTIPIASGALLGTIFLPQKGSPLVLFAHGSGSSRLSPRNQAVASDLREAGLGTFLFDLLTAKEELADDKTGELRFDIPFLTKRLLQATEWTMREHAFPICYFGASTGAAAALAAAAVLGTKIQSIVSRGGRPDLATSSLGQVVSPTLLIVGGLDYGVIELNREAFAQLHCPKKLEIVPGATHLFEEPGTLRIVAKLAAAWFLAHRQKK